jgi:dihydrofolate reductase
MRLVVTQNITLNGIVEQNEETGAWFTVAGDADMSDVVEALGRMMAEEDAQLHGRITFEQMRGFWPNQTGDTTGVTDHLNRVDKYVLSSTMDDPQWENSTVLTGDLRDEVRSLKDRPGGNLGVTGSISVCHDLIRADLVDEYRLLVYSVVVGRGRRLFGGPELETRPMKLIDTQRFDSGIVLLAYQPT